MINLSATTDLIEMVTSSGADIDVHCSYTEQPNPVGSSDSVTVDRKATKVTTATTTDISGSPASSKTRTIKGFIAFNIDGSVSNTLTFQHTLTGPVVHKLGTVTLLAGEYVIFDGQKLWHYDTNGGIYGVGQVFASQSDQETGTSTVTVVAPGTQHFHQSALKCWGKATVSGAVPTLQVSYNTQGISDTATDRLGVTIDNDFSSTNYACVPGIEAATTSLSATTTSLAVFIRNATFAAGTFEINACEFDIGQATDPASWSWLCAGDR
jgi:hypothetical protein